MAGRIKFLLIFITLFSGYNKALELSGIFIPVVHAYMDDVFCMPLVLTLSLLALRRIMNNATYTLSIVQISAAVIYCSILFEVVLPIYSSSYIADYMDVVCYIFGAIFFLKKINTGTTEFAFTKA